MDLSDYGRRLATYLAPHCDTIKQGTVVDVDPQNK